jgi:hypothetical protein
MPDRVECRSETGYAGQPMAIHWHGWRKQVLQIIATWRTPQEIGYRVMTADMKIYDCIYSEIDDIWTINEI